MIAVCELDEGNIQDVNKCDGSFTVNSRLVLHMEKDAIRYTVASLTPY